MVDPKEPAPTQTPSVPKSAKSEIEIAKEVGKEIAREVVQGAGLYKRSAEEFDGTYPYDPKSYDVKSEADKIAEKRGHRLSKWLPADDKTSDFFHAKCLECGEMVTARWRKAPKNDNRAGTDGQYPELGGIVLSKNCDECQSPASRQLRQTFTARS